MKIDGKKIAQEIKSELRSDVESCDKKINLDIVMVGSDRASKSFIQRKVKFGKEIGVDVFLHKFDSDILQVELEGQLSEILRTSEGCIVQLPLPEHIDKKKILDLVPADLDVDMLGSASYSSFESGTSSNYPPVAGAVREALLSIDENLSGKNIVILGCGELVGKPVSTWLKNKNIEHDIVDIDTGSETRKELLRGADIIISGIGKPNSLTSSEIKDGVILIDAGTSELKKRLVGDIYKDCYNRASFYTPVPGGIGPITVAILFRNLINNVCK